MTNHNPIDHGKLKAHAERLNKEAESWTDRQLRMTYSADAHGRKVTKPIDWHAAPMPMPLLDNPTPTPTPTMTKPTPTMRRFAAALCLTTYTLLALKVFGGVDMSWWVVLSPLWGPLALCIVLGSVLTLVRGR